MPAYKVTAPDGKSYTVNAPDGASQDDVMAYVQANYQHPTVASGGTLQGGQQAGQQPAVQGSFDTGVQQALQQAQAQDAIKPSVGQQIGDALQQFGTAEGHHLMSGLHGITQLAEHGLNSAANTFLPDGNPIRTRLNSDTAQDDAWLAKHESDYQNSVPNSGAAYAGAATGEIAPFLFEAPAKILGSIGEGATKILPASMQGGRLAKILSGITQGGVVGATQPVTNPTSDGQTLAGLVTGNAPAPSYAAQKAQQIGVGAGTGGIIPAGAAVAGGIKGVIQHAMGAQPVIDANIARLFGSNPEVLAKLQGAQQFVPGEVPTAAQAIASPEAVQAERMLRNNPSSAPAFVANDAANNQARTAVVNNIAGDDAAMQAAKDARKANAAPFVDNYLTPTNPAARWSQAATPIDDALSKPMPRDDDFRALTQAKQIIGKVNNGSMQEDDALEAMKELGDSVSSQKAQNAFSAAGQAIDKNMVDPSGVQTAIATLRNGPLGVDPEVASGLDHLAGQIKQGSNINGKIGVDMLDAVRQQASKLLGNASSQQGIAFGPVKNQIVDAIDRVAPGYRDYLAKYAQDSAPINTMESGQRLGGALDLAGRDATGNPRLTIAQLKSALKGDDKARYPMSDGARQQLDNVGQSLARRTISDNNIGAAGPGTAADLQAQGKLAGLVFGSNMGTKGGVISRLVGSGLGATLGSTMGPVGTAVGAGIGGGLSDLIGAANSRVIGKVGATAANANETAAAIQRYMTANAPQRAQLLQQYPQLRLLISAQPAQIATQSRP